MNDSLLSGPRVLVALDFDHPDKCMSLVDQLDPAKCRLKIGKELFTQCGPSLVEQVQSKGFDVFLDLKYHDIPNTVAKAVAAAARLGVWMVNVHAGGGPRMLVAAREALASFQQRPLLIGVTVLTSMDEHDFKALGIERSPQQQVQLYSELVKASGLDGVVCSAQEAPIMKQQHGSHFITVTPGIRPVGASVGDQRRVVTPAQAIKNGSDFLVIGRPITQAQNPLDACNSICAEIDAVIQE